MASPTVSLEEAQVWESLKQAISSSSGFKRWQQEYPSTQLASVSLDVQVRRYLRETLKALAY